MHTIELNNGFHLAYRDHGKGPVMVLVHGWGVSGELFLGQLQGLSDRFRMIVPDLPGHGASGNLPEDGSFTSLTDAIAELIGQLELKPVCLVGWSLGAMVAWDLLQRHPDLYIGSLVTIDMVPCLLNDTSWRYGLRESDDVSSLERNTGFMLSNWPAYTSVVVPRWLSPAAEASPQLVEHVRQVMLQNDPHSMAQIWGWLEKQDMRQALPGIRIPSLVIAGGKSSLFTPVAAAWVAQQITGARLEVFADSGHAPHLDQPHRFNQLLAEFSSTISKQSAVSNGINKI